MDKATISAKLRGILRQMFNQPQLEIRDDLTAADVEGWDSLTHVDLIVAVEEEFGIKLTTANVRRLNNVGEFITIIGMKAK